MGTSPSDRQLIDGLNELVVELTNHADKMSDLLDQIVSSDLLLAEMPLDMRCIEAIQNYRNFVREC